MTNDAPCFEPMNKAFVQKGFNDINVKWNKDMEVLAIVIIREWETFY